MKSIVFVISSSRCVLINPLTKPNSHAELLLQASNFSSSNAVSCHFSPNTSSGPNRRHEESRNVRVSVWWDFENCGLPAGMNVFRVAQSITSAIRSSGIKGPIQITAFGDVTQLSRSNQEGLSSTGIAMTHVPHGGKNSADRSLLVDLMYWVTQNPPPAHLFLISGDRDFAGILHRLRMSNYNILLASPEQTPTVLCSAASIMWQWNALVKGENINGKVYNQPPDGPYSSWYGYYKAPLEDPFAWIEQKTCTQANPSESGPDSKHRPIPEEVVKQIRHILNCYPTGISITDLRAKLVNSSIDIDKELYGHKKFSRFLYRMPDVLKLERLGDGQYYVKSVVQRAPKEHEPSFCISSDTIVNVDLDFTGSSTLNRQNDSNKGVIEDNFKPNTEASPKLLEKPAAKLPDHPVTKMQHPATTILDPESKMQEPSTKMQEPSTKMQEPSTKMQEPSIKMQEPSIKMQEPSTKMQEPSTKMQEPSTKRQDLPIRMQDPTETQDEQIKVEEPSTDIGLASRKNSTDSIMYNANEVKSTPKVGFFRRIWRKWFGGKDNCSPEVESCKQKSCSEVTASVSAACAYSHADNYASRSPKPDNNKSRMAEICMGGSFWKEMEAFMGTTQCLDAISKSNSRERMAQNLQKMGPNVLRSLNRNELLELVDLLISDKKWIEESSSQRLPFKLARADQKTSSISEGSDGLSSLFRRNQVKAGLQCLSEQSDEEKHQNSSHVGVPVISKNLSMTSRNKMLSDCQKLVEYVVKEHPEGFNLGLFRKLFYDKYDYSLHVQKLGYSKLEAVIRTMRGADVLDGFIVRSYGDENSGTESINGHFKEKAANHTVANSDSELSDASKAQDELDSSWDELGPVANVGSKQNATTSESSRKVSSGSRGQKNHYYETLSEFSDSEEEAPPSKKMENAGRAKIQDEDSSLLQILDSWYGSKEESNRGGALEKTKVAVDGFGSASSGVATKIENNSVKSGRKYRPSKGYSFVLDKKGDDKDRIIDSILGSLEKTETKPSSESGM